VLGRARQDQAVILEAVTTHLAAQRIVRTGTETKLIARGSNCRPACAMSCLLRMRAKEFATELGMRDSHKMSRNAKKKRRRMIRAYYQRAKALVGDV
jgi:hypothetical protein